MAKTELARSIIEQALPMVPFDGWTSKTLAVAAEAAGISPDYVSILFPDGAMDAIDAFVLWADEQMSQSADSDFSSLKTPQKITRLMLERLERFAPHREAVRRAVHTCLLPWNVARAGGITFRTIDTMWKLAGASDHDFNWYTRRATLAYVYTTTLKYWLSEEGENSEHTAAYLQRRLNEAAWVGKAAQKVKGLQLTT